MNIRLAAPVLAVLGACASMPAFAASVPCEEMLRQLRDRETTTPVKDASKAAYEELKAKGIERCNADDDKRADDFFAQAMTLLGN